MKEKDILNAMTHVKDEHIAAAAPTGKKSPRRMSIRAVSLVACLCVCVCTLFVIAPWRDRTPDVLRPTISEDGVTIPPLEITLNRDIGMMSDMIGFFIYGGRVYTHYMHVNATDMVGEYVGTSTGMIDEWTKEDGYVDFAGSIGGDFYTVKGYDPSFMLCMTDGNTATLYINNNGMTLKTGADLYEDRLHLKGNILRVEAETRESWYLTQLKVMEIGDEYRETIDRFVDALYAAPFMISSDIPLAEGQSSIYDALEIYHLYLYTADSVPVHLRLFRGGYVILQGMFDVCVYVEGDAFDDLIRMLDQHAAKYAKYEASIPTS